MEVPAVEQLARWIDSHYPPEPTLVNADGSLTVSVACTHINSSEVTIERDVIPATVKAARAWLGY